MIYTIENRTQPLRIFDASGRKWKYLTMCDTETGEIEQFKMNEDGTPRLNATRTAVATRTLKVPAPLVVVPA